MKRIIGAAVLACVLASAVTACGGAGEGPPLGEFAAISKKETDAPFVLSAPSSRSPAAFVYTSSNPAVATVSGATVTIKGVGQAEITAAQPGYESYGPTHTSTTLTVSAACVSPATVANYACTAPVSPGASATTVDGLIYARVLHTDTYAHATDFCAGTVIDSVANWRLPTQAELARLVASGAIAGHDWQLGKAWSSTAASGASGAHVAVDLETGVAANRTDMEVAYVSCVRGGV
jgi:hypothetical protein